MLIRKTGLEDETYKRVQTLVLPIIIDNAVNMIAGSICMAILGRYGAIAVGGYGISNRVIQIIYSLFRGITLGSTILIAQAHGAGQTQKVKHLTHQTLLSSVLLVTLLQQIIYWQAAPILEFFKPDMELKAQALFYLRTLSWALPFMAVRITAAVVLQGMGDSKTPMKISMMMNTLYVIATFALSYGGMGISGLGMKGAAFGLIAAEATAAALGIGVLFGRNGMLRDFLNKFFFRLDIRQIYTNYKVGLPVALEATFWQFTTAIMTKTILTYGQDALAGYYLGIQAESISYVVESAAGVAATALFGQAMGSHDYALGKRLIHQLSKLTIVITGVLSVILLVFPAALMHLLTDSEGVVFYGIQYLIFMSFVQIPQNLTALFNGAIRGGGHTRTPMFISGAGLWLIRILFSLLCTYVLGWSLTAIWVVIIVDLLIRFVVSYVLYRRMIQPTRTANAEVQSM